MLRFYKTIKRGSRKFLYSILLEYSYLKNLQEYRKNMVKELEIEKNIIENKGMQIRYYNYSYIMRSFRTKISTENISAYHNRPSEKK